MYVAVSGRLLALLGVVVMAVGCGTEAVGESEESSSLTQPTTTDSVVLHSAIIEGSNLVVTYSKNFTTCAHLLNASNQITHSNNHYCTSGQNVTVTQPLSSFSGVTVGTQVKLCHGNNYGICSALVPVQAASVTLHRAVTDGSSLVLTYSKNFATCAHLLNSSNQITHSNNHYCTSGQNITVTQPLSAFSGVTVGTQVKLCHGNNYGICSALVPVQAAVTLHSAVISGSSLVLTYSKSFATCAHLLNSSNQITHSNNHYCTSGANITVTQPLSAFSGIAVGTQVKLCNGNNYGMCSALVSVR